MVEFAIVLPLLILVVFGILEFALAWNRVHIITDAAREGARVGAVSATTRAQVIESINRHLTQNGLNPALATLTVPTTWPVPTGQPLTVTVAYPTTFRVLSRLVPGIRATRTVSTTFTMRRE
jgi:Flp pilus assembly protein TadG